MGWHWKTQTGAWVTVFYWMHRARIDGHAVWLAARDPRTPLALRLFGLAVAAYALSPIDIIPDFVPLLGLLDDAILIPFGVYLFVSWMPEALWDEHQATAEAASHRPVSRAGIAIVVGVWLAVLGLIAGYVWSWGFY